MRGIDVYVEQQKHINNDELIHQHSSLVLKIAKKIIRKLPSSVELDDLIQSGYLGLLEASRNYQEGKGASFETFASIRIKGAIIDELRKNTWNSREASKNLRHMGEVISQIEQKEMREAKSSEIAHEMGLSIDEYEKACQKITFCNVLALNSIDDCQNAKSEEDGPENIQSKHEHINLIKSGINKLDEREKILLSLYYIEEITFKEISIILELTEARVCQLHASALAKIKKDIC